MLSNKDKRLLRARIAEHIARTLGDVSTIDPALEQMLYLSGETGVELKFRQPDGPPLYFTVQVKERY